MWELDYKESWMLKNRCFWTVVLEKTLESPLDSKEIQQSILKEISLNIHWKDWCWSWHFNTLATWCEELTRNRPWCWERLKAGREGDDTEWDGWMVLPIRSTWVWANSGRQWRTGKPGVLQSMGLQRVSHEWVTEQQPPHRIQAVTLNSKTVHHFEAWEGLYTVFFFGVLWSYHFTSKRFSSSSLAALLSC